LNDKKKKTIIEFELEQSLKEGYRCLTLMTLYLLMLPSTPQLRFFFKHYWFFCGAEKVKPIRKVTEATYYYLFSMVTIFSWIHAGPGFSSVLSAILYRDCHEIL
jgi:hypothetical protein